MGEDTGQEQGASDEVAEGLHVGGGGVFLLEFAPFVGDTFVTAVQSGVVVAEYLVPQLGREDCARGKALCGYGGHDASVVKSHQGVEGLLGFDDEGADGVAERLRILEVEDCEDVVYLILSLSNVDRR